MHRHASRVSRFTVAAITLALLTPLILATTLATSVLAATPSPSPTPASNPDIAITARAMLGGNVRPGAWTAVAVHVENTGPAVDGEMRIDSGSTTTSQYGLEVHLPNGAKQDLTLYAQTAIFGSRINVDLVVGDQTIERVTVPIKSHDAYNPIVAVVAEHPEGFLAQVGAAMVNPNTTSPTVITIGPSDLPPRVEAWAAIDRLVWQDIDAQQLTEAQSEALRLWVGAGGQLVILGGPNGTGTLTGFDQPQDDLLPITPLHTIDVAAADLVPLVGSVPDTVTTTPAIGGTLRRGSILARSGDDVIAAQSGYGRGEVTFVGVDPSTTWLATGAPALALWHRLLPVSTSQALNPLTLTDDSQIVNAMQNLPSVDLPPIEQLFVLLVAYIALVGPINYVVLRRLDKREWAWVTIPALVVVFAVGSYGLGASLKGSDVIVNEVGVVRAAQGSDKGIGQFYVGIYSPSRQSFQVSIPGGALLSNPLSQINQTGTEQPLDVLFGDSASELRNFDVGYGVVRGFRAEAPADSPQVDSDLHFAAGKLQGTITNRSDETLENLALVFGGGVAIVPSLEAGKTTTVDIDTTNTLTYGYQLSQVVFGSGFGNDAATQRKVYTRQAVLDQLFNYGSVPTTDTPLLLAWRDGTPLDVDLAGDTPNKVGDSLYMISLGMSLDANQVFANQAMTSTVIATSADQAWGDQNGFYLTRGTMTVDSRPIPFSGTFNASLLEISLTQGDISNLSGKGKFVEPLPPDKQPPQDDPLGDGSAQPTPTSDPNATPDPNATGPIPTPIPPIKPGCCPGPNGFGLPALQLFDRVSQQWVEFPDFQPSEPQRITDPERYVDSSGSVLMRLVNRAQGDQFGSEQLYFQINTRLEGTIE